MLDPMEIIERIDVDQLAAGQEREFGHGLVGLLNATCTVNEVVDALMSQLPANTLFELAHAYSISMRKAYEKMQEGEKK